MTNRMPVFISRSLIGALAALLACALPLAVLAQSATSSDAQLSATIRAELLSDPRSSELTQAQLDSMVNLLTNAAKQQGMTADQITWRPAPNQSFSSASAASASSDCGNIPGPLCALNIAFGFSGSDPVLAIWLGITALLLILLITLAFEIRHRRHMAHATPEMKRQA